MQFLGLQFVYIQGQNNMGQSYSTVYFTFVIGQTKFFKSTP